VKTATVRHAPPPHPRNTPIATAASSTSSERVKQSDNPLNRIRARHVRHDENQYDHHRTVSSPTEPHLTRRERHKLNVPVRHPMVPQVDHSISKCTHARARAHAHALTRPPKRRWQYGSIGALRAFYSSQEKPNDTQIVDFDPHQGWKFTQHDKSKICSV
jgi:hypothetical protein